MVYQICKRCHKMVEKTEGIYCKPCYKKITKDYDLIVKYITQYPMATVLEIVTETGAELKSIDCLLEDGSLSEKSIQKT